MLVWRFTIIMMVFRATVEADCFAKGGNGGKGVGLGQPSEATTEATPIAHINDFAFKTLICSLLRGTTAST